MVLQIAQFNPAFRSQDRREHSVPVLHEKRVNPDRRQSSRSLFDLHKLKEDVDRLDKSTQQKLLYALSPLPPARRISSLPDTVENKNWSRAGLLAGMAAANFPGDLREMGLAFKNPFAKRPYQHEMSFFKLTLLDKLPKKYPWLSKMDKTFFSTGFGKFVRKKLNIGIDLSDIGKIEDACTKTPLKGYKYTGNFLQRTLGRAMHRLPVIGLFATSALEIPALITSITKTKGNIWDKTRSFGKQLIKSGGYIGFTTAAITIAGAITFPCSALLGLIGMAAGSTLGLIASKKLNKLVDGI